MAVLTHYTLPGLRLASEYPFAALAAFRSDLPCELPLCTLRLRYGPVPQEQPLLQIDHTDFRVCKLEQGWLYLPAGAADYALLASADYRHLTAYLAAPGCGPERLMPLLRTALECARIPQGVLSLHSACVEWQGEGLCFTAPSGVGKSTRAMSWQSGLGAGLISGDRPSICVQKGNVTVSGAPWDGKEQLFCNQTVPLRAICYIRRGEQTRVRRLSAQQAQKILCQQCFVPMWDTEAAAMVMLWIRRLCAAVPIYRVTCGPDEAAAKQLRDILFYHPEQIREVEQDMKIKPGFVLRNMAGEHIVMPTGKNISQFDGTIVLNEVAAFVWEQLNESCSREELVQAILAEFDVDRPRAEADLDALLAKLHEYQVIEEAV